METSFTSYTLEQLVTFEKSYSFSRATEGEGKYKHIHYGDIHTKLPYIIDKAEELPSIEEQGDLVTVNYGDILVADASEDTKDLGKAICYLDSNCDSVVAGLHTIRMNINKNIALPEYLINLFQTKRYRKFVWKMGTGVSVLGLSKTNLATYQVSLPSLETQKEIANYFIKINKKIQLQQEKINLLKEQKKGFMQKIFSQEWRFKDKGECDFPNWTNLSMNEIVKVNLREIPKPTEPYERLGLRSHAKGTFHETINNPKEVDMDKLYVVHEGDLVINITFAWEQAFAIANKSDHGKLVSHRFPTYVFKTGHYNLFYKYYLTTKLFKYHLKNASPGGAGRNRVLNRSDFLKIEMKCPSYKEQIKIAHFLGTLDERINAEGVRLGNLIQQKQGLMQQMFI